ncbi:MAG: MMPL family transporter [Tenericutes bacterium]|nr:MMPL family transporter [Mycoplasmatota bacterium]
MRKVTDFIVKARYVFLTLFVILAIFSLYLGTKVNINEDIMKYLPETSEIKIGKDIMDEEFIEQDSSVLNVMFKGLSDTEKEDTLKKLESINGVSSVLYENTDEYNRDKYTLYVLNVDDYDHSKTAENVYNEVNEMKPEAMSGSIYNEWKPVLQIWIVVVAIAMAMIILTILSESYIEPWLYLISIGVAVFINKGTNIIFPSVSNITDSIVAILQLALSMDYSIMLSNRYRQEREKEKDKTKAMKNALYNSFKAISSSSITTVVGLLALVFMSFTIGRDLGLVLAKGVVLSLVSIFFCLPGLLVLCDKLIMNSKKKTINFNLKGLGKYSYKTRWVQLVFIIASFIAAYILKGNIGILYTGTQQDEVGKHFPSTNQIAIIYENKYDEIITKYCKSIEDDEKVNQVLCYGNTINEKLAYNELNQKFKDLGQDTEIDDYLIKIIYYNYYNKNTKDSMTLSEFTKFIKSDVYSNEKVSESIDDNIKENMDLLENFATKDNVNQKRTASEIANILDMNESDANDLLIYYNSKHLDTKMSIKDFVNFMINEVRVDPNYGSSVDANTLASLKQLQPFINTNTINKQMTSNEIANTFGIDKSLVDQLFLFYRTTQDSKSTMTINEFANVALNMSNQDAYKDMFDESTIKSLNMLSTLSSEQIITNELDVSSMKTSLNNLGLSLDDNTMSLLYIYYTGYNTNSKLTLNGFANVALNMAEQDAYKSYFSEDTKKSLQTIVTLNSYYDTVLPNANLYSMFGIDAETGAKLNYAITGDLSGSYSMTPLQFVNTLLQTPEITSELNSNQISQLSTALYVMSNITTTYSVDELTNALQENKTIVSVVYGVYDYQNGNLKNISVRNLINFLYENKSNPFLSDKLSTASTMLDLTYKIVNNTNTRYTYKEMAALIEQNESTVKNIYGVADYSGLTTTMNPLEFVNLILNNKDNELLKGKIDNSTISTLNLVKKVMESTLNNTKYNATDLAKLLGSDKDTLSLVLSLYNSRYIKANSTISLIDFTNFIISDVIPNPTYSSKIDNESKDKLNTVNAIMNNTLNGTKYNSLDLYNVLNKLSDGLDYNLIDIVYTYYGSKNNYDDSWKLTVEEIVNYLNNDLLKDEKYSSFLDADMTKTIKDAKNTIDDAKKLLVSDKYSRAIINSKYGAEDKDTFKFIQNALDTVGENDGVYVVGESPMALEMSQSFNGELNYITILTMIFIFVVVAITFKDLLVPLILVLMIQCAVYVTMAVLSITGSSVYFIALLIVQAILMGATIDYAIVYTTYYKEMRETMGVRDSLVNAYNKSIHTILSSSSILIIVTLVVASFSEAIPAMICKTVSEGTFCSVILILFVLPGVLAAFDKLICRKEYYK